MPVEIDRPEVDKIHAALHRPLLQRFQLLTGHLGQRRQEFRQFDIHRPLPTRFAQDRLRLEYGHFKKWRRTLAVLLHDLTRDGHQLHLHPKFRFQRMTMLAQLHLKFPRQANHLAPARMFCRLGHGSRLAARKKPIDAIHMAKRARLAAM